MDFTEPLFYVIVLIGAGVIGALSATYKRLTERFDWLDELDADNVVDEYIYKGIRWAKSHLKELTEKHGKEVDLNAPEVIEDIVNWIIPKIPKALSKLGFNKEYIRDLVESYIEDM